MKMLTAILFAALALSCRGFDLRLAWGPSSGAASYSIFRLESNGWHYAVSSTGTTAVVSNIPLGRQVFAASSVSPTGVESELSDPATGIVRRVVLSLERGTNLGAWTVQASYTNEFVQTNSVFLRTRLETQ